MRFALRYVFIDEAGTSTPEPVSVVVGVIVHADNQMIAAEKAVQDALELIPLHLRNRCEQFHAKAIWGDKSLRDSWSIEERKKLLQTMMAIPREINLAIAVGACRRDTQLPPEALKSISLTQAHHGIAFQECIAWTDLWIRKFAGANEIATVIAEDVPETKRLLKHMANWLRTTGYIAPAQDVRIHQPMGTFPLATKDEFRRKTVTRIRTPIYFANKSEEPLLQIADACAFGFRRFLARQSYGDDFIETVVGSPQDISTFETGFSAGGIFSWEEKSNVTYTFGPWRG